jgi:hypothetical protein
MSTLVQIKKSGAIISCDKNSMLALHNEFNKNHYIKLKEFLDTDLLQYIRSLIQKSGYIDFKHSNVDAVDYQLKDETANNILKFLLNNKGLFDFIEEITSCSKIGCFFGRVFQMNPSLGHYDSWHSDLIDKRMVALSINLSTDVYSGGTLQIKDVNSDRIIQEVSNTGFGDAVIFKLSPHLNHRVTEVTGKACRTVFSGWFRSEPVYKPFSEYPKIQITKVGIVHSSTEQDLTKLSDDFSKQQCVKLPKLLNEELLKFIQSQISKSEFYEVNYPASGQDNPMHRLKDKAPENLLRFLINDQTFFEFIQKITGCPKIGSFTGRICSMSPNLGHRDAWHNDLVDNRMIAMSINLSTDIYSGGILQIRNVNSGEVIHEIANTGFGDAIIFRIAPDLEHRLTEVTGKASRTFFAGWFRSEPLYKPLNKSLLDQHDPRDLIMRDYNDADQTVPKHSKVYLKSELFFQNLESNTLVFNPLNDKCFEIDPIGAKILSVLKKPLTVLEIRDAILDEYDVNPDRCEADILSLLEAMKSGDIIALQDINTKEEQKI